ncbi:hypothetical protein ABN028_29955 [Actinopolymorpha sp. B17G11]|uniref:YxiG-like protein n=1 Tax=Actinopolymorpha sp. B17G11 TaxID=3160861 RepID=UPI0032E475C6
MDAKELREALEDVFDQGLVFHGYADYMRDYDVYVYAAADPRTGIGPAHLRYRFTHCVKASVTTAVRRDVWPRSLGDEFTEYDEWLRSGEPEGYVWGVKWQCLYPGMQLMPESDETRDWSALLGLPFREVLIETNGHNITLIFADLRVSVVEPGAAPFVVAQSGPDGKIPLP